MSPGTAMEAQAVRLLAEAATAGRSGILRATRGKHRRLICLERGRVAMVASNVIEEQFHERLVQQQVLSLGERADAQAAAAAEGKKIAAWLLEQGKVEAGRLRVELERHVRELVLETLSWSDGEIVFDAGRPNLKGELTVRLSCVPLILEHTRSHPASMDEVRIGIGPPNTRPGRSERAAGLLEGVTLPDVARTVLEASDGTRDVSVLLSQSTHPADAVLRALYGLILLGILESSRADAATDARATAQVTRDECLARLHQAEHADHYLILGVDPKAAEPEIRSAYYTLARRFHPDRFSTGPLADLRPRIETYFTRVTEAYNTLSDPDQRKQYDEELAHRLAEQRSAPDRDTTRLARENFARARILLDKKRYQDAVTFLENAVQLDDTRFEFHLELGRVLTLNPRRRKDAEQHLIRASEIDPTSVPALIAIGQLYRRMGRGGEAAAKFEEALRWEPENVEARQELDAIG